MNKRPGFSFTYFIGILWSIHVLIAALLYPNFLLPADDFQNKKNIQKEKLYTAFRLWFGTFILFFNFLCIIILFTRSTLIDAAKVLFVLVTWLLLAVIYILFNHLRGIYFLLSALEDNAIQSRDQSVMLIRAGQAALRAGNNKLYGGEVEQFSYPNLLKKIGPLAILILRKGNLWTIVGEALKFALSAARVF